MSQFESNSGDDESRMVLAPDHCPKTVASKHAYLDVVPWQEEKRQGVISPCLMVHDHYGMGGIEPYKMLILSSVKGTGSPHSLRINKHSLTVVEYK